MLRKLLLLVLMFVLPLQASMAGMAQLSEMITRNTPVSKQDFVHEHRDFLGSIELHQHKASDVVNSDSGKSSTPMNCVPAAEHSQLSPVWVVSTWPASDPFFPSDFSPAPPEQPPRACA